jgi:hypothetical protein
MRWEKGSNPTRAIRLGDLYMRERERAWRQTSGISIFKSSGVVLCVILGGELMARVLLERLWQLFYIFICLWNPELITRHVHRMEWLVFGPKSNSSKTTKVFRPNYFSNKNYFLTFVLLNFFNFLNLEKIIIIFL